MKHKLLLLIVVLIPVLAVAQDADKALVQAKAQAALDAQADLKKVDTGEKAWKLSGVLGLNASATGLVNWAAGGKNNAAGQVFAKLRLLYHKDNIAWDTNLDMEYGLTYLQQDEDALQKASDKINFATKLGWEFHPTWYLTALAGFQSQFALGHNYVTGYNDVISKWLAPSYTDISVGIDWKANDIFSVYLSPVAGRITTAWISDGVNDRLNKEFNDALDAGLIDVTSDWYQKNAAYFEAGADGYRTLLQNKYAVYNYERGDDGNWEETPVMSNVRAELGLSFKGQINYKFKDLTLLSTLGLYTPYSWRVNKDAAGKNYFVGYRHFGKFDVDWDVAISYQFLKCLNVTLTTSTRYYSGVMIADKNGVEAERVQFMTTLGLGVGYSF